MKKIIFLLIFATAALAQSFDGVGLGLADNYAVLSRGIHAINYNPANVALPRGNFFELNIVGLRLSVFNNSFSLNDYNHFFVTNGDENYWSSNTKKEFLDLFPDDGLKMYSNIMANAFGFAFNNFALAVQPVLVGMANPFTDKEPLKIALYGDHISKDYQRHFTNLVKGSSFAAVKVSLAYGYPFLQIQKYLPDFSYVSVGIGVNYYIALAAAEVQQSEILIQRTQYDAYEQIEIKMNGQARTAILEGGGPVGKGRSFNFGLATKYKEKWNFALSFIDIMGKINYNSQTKLLQIKEYQNIKIYKSTDRSSESHETSIDTTMDIDGFETDVPSVMRLGASYQYKPNLIFTAEYLQGLDHSFGNATTPRFGAGVFYKPLWWLPVRGGFSLGGNNGFLLAFGSGIDLKYFAFDFSMAMKNALWPTHSEGVFMGLNLIIRL